MVMAVWSFFGSCSDVLGVIWLFVKMCLVKTYTTTSYSGTTVCNLRYASGYKGNCRELETAFTRSSVAGQTFNDSYSTYAKVPTPPNSPMW